MDPIGYGLEGFDAIGRFRTTDNGKPVDAMGSLARTDVDGQFIGAVELGAKLATSSLAKKCMATQWFRFALGRSDTDSDACSIQGAAHALDASDDLKDVVVAIATSEAFRYARWVPGP
jgi:hypothetical protein